MPDRDVVLAKVATIRKCLDRIREVTDLDPGKLEDINRQDIFVLNLQRAVQALELDILKSILRWFSICSLPCFVFLFVALFQLSLQSVDPSFQIGRVERFVRWSSMRPFSFLVAFLYGSAIVRRICLTVPSSLRGQ